MSKTQKREVTFNAGCNVPPGVTMHLDFGQADARRFVLKPVKGWHKSRKEGGRRAFVADRSVYFKAGETVELEWPADVSLDRGLEMATATPVEVDSPSEAGDDDTPGEAALRKQFDAAWAKQTKELEDAKAGVEKARAEGHAAGRAEMLAEVEARNALFEAEAEAQALVDTAANALAEVGEDKKAEAEAALTNAKAALAAATAAVTALPELKA